jgi:hypothetical protein
VVCCKLVHDIGDTVFHYISSISLYDKYYSIEIEEIVFYVIYQSLKRKRYSSVGIPTDWTAEVRFQAEPGNLPLFHNVQTISGAHPDFRLMRTRRSFPGGKRPGREADHSPLSSAEVKNCGVIRPLPRTFPWCGA